jgi:hypothetical protein
MLAQSALSAMADNVRAWRRVLAGGHPVGAAP